MSRVRPALRAGKIHLWRARLDLAGCLSDDERARAERFRFADLRRRFVAAQRPARGILGRYAERAPGSLRFEYGAHGKTEAGRLTLVPRQARSTRNEV